MKCRTMYTTIQHPFDPFPEAESTPTYISRAALCTLPSQTLKERFATALPLHCQVFRIINLEPAAGLYLAEVLVDGEPGQHAVPRRAHGRRHHRGYRGAQPPHAVTTSALGVETAPWCRVSPD